MGGMRAEFSENVGKRPLGRPRMRRDDSIYIYIYIYVRVYMLSCCQFHILFTLE